MKSLQIHKQNWIICFVLLLTVSCYDIPCRRDCFSPPEALQLRITDPCDSTDLVYAGFYNSDSISIYYFIGSNKIDIEIEIYSDTLLERSIIFANEIEWRSVEGYKDYFLYLNSNEIDSLYLNVESKSENCCVWHPVLDFAVNGEPIEPVHQSTYTLKKNSKEPCNDS